MLDMVKGFRTIIVGLMLAVAPSALDYLVNVDWNVMLGPKGALAVSGVLMIVLRLVTNTPVGKKPAETGK